MIEWQGLNVWRSYRKTRHAYGRLVGKHQDDVDVDDEAHHNIDHDNQHHQRYDGILGHDDKHHHDNSPCHVHTPCRPDDNHY